MPGRAERFRPLFFGCRIRRTVKSSGTKHAWNFFNGLFWIAMTIWAASDLMKAKTLYRTIDAVIGIVLCLGGVYYNWIYRNLEDE
ncbi:MAG: hypothetical protein DMG31_08335 [Acidobacteria bacterium]|nr:MAG: hypothetical protein DMG31_08335 [Acidobacteriota bacterium]